MRILTFILTINSLACFGQQLFIDNVKQFPWTSEGRLDVSQIGTTRKIGLTILRTPIDSLKENKTIWVFGEDLTVNYYDTNKKSQERVLRCKYDFDWDKGLLMIQWPGSGQVTYRFSFVSTGVFMLLTKRRAKKQL